MAPFDHKVPDEDYSAPGAGECRPASSTVTGVRVVIVCSCNVISDHQVRSVTTAHAVRATSEVYRCLGCSAACGRCARTIRHIMNEALADEAAVVTASPSICTAPEPPLDREEQPQGGLALAAS